MTKNSKLAPFLLALVFVLVLSSACLSSSELEKISIYRIHIDEQIDRCSAKIRFIDSDSHNLRLYGQRELRKAEFFSRGREMLLLKMIDNHIEAKDYKIQYYLNSQFYETVLE